MSERSVGSVVAVVVLAVLAGVVVSAAVPADGRTATTGSGTPVATTTPPGDSVADQVETDSVRLTVDVLANGSARWTVEYQTVLDDQNTTEAFESLQEDIDANRSAYVDRFADRIRSTVGTAENATGREMSATDFRIATTIEQVDCPSPNGCGVIRYTFRWDGFARVEDGGDRLAIGDAIEGFFLNENTRLEIGWPADYGRVNVEPEPDGSNENAVLWRGSSTDFVSGEPQVVVERGATTTTTANDGTTTATTTTIDGTTTTTTEDPAGAGGGLPLVPIAAVLVVVLALVGAGGWWWTSGGGSGGPAPTAGDGGSPDGTAAAAAGDGSGDGNDDEDEPFDIDQELLSNEEQVIKLLEANEGRLKQQEVVSELDWTEAKTSQVISGMREEGSIDTFRLGRENVVTLPDEEIGIGPERQDGE